VSRARVVWNFDQHPARFANGKLLLYFWLGWFDLEPITALHLSRTAIALFTLITGAALFGAGRQMGGYWAGVIALGLYAVLPLSLFFERMALADPFAAGFVTLLAWRSVVFACHPTRREGVMLGVLITAAMMAKLTMGLVPLLPVAATLIYYPRQFRWRAWMVSYWPGLSIAAMTVVVLWLPVLIPAFLARNDKPFVLINAENLQQLDAANPLQDFGAILPQFTPYVSLPFFIACMVAIVYLLWQERRGALLILVWLALIVLLPVIASKDMRSRYLMPVAGPLALLIACAAARAWKLSGTRRWVRGILLLGGTLWLVAFALPFAYTAMTDPTQLDLSPREHRNYFSANFAGDALRRAAFQLEHIEPRAEHIYASYGTCQALYFFTLLDVQCLEDAEHPIELLNHENSYVVFNGHEPEPDQLSLDWELIGFYPRDTIDRDVRVWRVSK